MIYLRLLPMKDVEENFIMEKSIISLLLKKSGDYMQSISSSLCPTASSNQIQICPPYEGPWV